MYLKNGLAEKGGGKKRKGRRKGGRKRKEKFGVYWERLENGEGQILKPMLIYLSSHIKQVHKGKKVSSFLNSKYKKLQPEINITIFVGLKNNDH